MGKTDVPGRLSLLLPVLLRHREHVLHGQHRLDAVRGSDSPGDDGDHLGNGQKRIQDNGKIGQKGQYFSDLRIPGVDPVGPGHHHGHQADVQHQVHDRIDHRHGQARGLFPLHHLIVDSGKALLLPVLLGQGLDHADACDIFPDGHHQAVQGLLELPVHGHAPARHRHHHHGEDRQGRQQDAGQVGVQCHGDAQTSDQQKRSPHPQALDSPDHVVNIVGVRGQPGDQGRLSQLSGLAVRQIQHLAEQIGPHRLSGPGRHPGGHAVGRDITDRRPCRQPQHHQAPGKDGAPLPLRDHHVDHPGQNPGQTEIQTGPAEFDGKPHQHAAVIRPQILRHNAFHVLPHAIKEIRGMVTRDTREVRAMPPADTRPSPPPYSISISVTVLPTGMAIRRIKMP